MNILLFAIVVLLHQLSVNVAKANHRLVFSSEDFSIHVINTSPNESDIELFGHNSHVFAIEKISDVQLASGSLDGRIKLWNLNSGECEHTLDAHEGSVLTLTYVQNQRLLISGSSDKTIRIWDLNSFQCERVLGSSFGYYFTSGNFFVSRL